jgi:MYXO-CTERM domain-containing protein
MTRFLLAVFLLSALPALAHIKLTSPESWQVTDSLGNPQKTAPCGEAGTASNVVTTVEAGSQLSVEWTDTIFHPGHYRISIAPNQGDFVDPVPVVNAGNCESAAIESTPTLPTIADGVYPHTTGSSGMARAYSITVPMMSCANCTLQLVQFMASHAPPCFYHQCATLRIVLPDAGTPDAGQPDAGNAVDAGTDAGTMMTDAGSMSDAGTMPGTDGGTADAGTDPGTSGGCGCSTPAVDASWLALVLALAARRRQLRR